VDENFDLRKRAENTRDLYKTDVVRFTLEEIMQHFFETLEIIKKENALGDELYQAKRKDEAEYIWRGQILLLAGALDFYMHELTKIGLCEIYDGNWQSTEKYKNIQVTMKYVEIGLKSNDHIDWFLDYVDQRFKYNTMVSFKDVKNQLNLLGINVSNIADSVFYDRDGEEKTNDKLKRRLDELFDRRNIIVHQTDRAHKDAQLKAIEKADVQNFIEDVEKIVCAIDNEARKMNMCYK
jgi:hypothetical protein